MQLFPFLGPSYPDPLHEPTIIAILSWSRDRKVSALDLCGSKGSVVEKILHLASSSVFQSERAWHL